MSPGVEDGTVAVGAESRQAVTLPGQGAQEGLVCDGRATGGGLEDGQGQGGGQGGLTCSPHHPRGQ